MKKEELLEIITHQYLNSRDFNGLALSGFKSEKANIIALVREGTIEINFGDKHPNPHIKAFELDDKDPQILKIESIGLEYACAYPTKKHLEKVVDINEFKDRPFTLKVALGEPQLNYAVFDLSVLEAYRNDPRYIYSIDGIKGRISVSDKYYPSSLMKDSDKVVLQYGFCYEKGTMNRAVAVFYRDLAYLTPEHQQIWNSKVLTGEYSLHPDYARSSAGHFYEKESIFVAFSEELHTINEFSRLMGRPSLSHESYRDKRPTEFGFLIRPTLKEFNSFVLLLDKMISDNINEDFFQRDVTRQTETKRSHGKTIVRPKATITLLKDWLDIRFKTPDPKPKNEMIETFRKIRRMRMKPAHKVDEDRFEQEYLKEQGKSVIEAYVAIRTLRLILQNHPETKTYTIPDWLFKGKIWDF